MMFLLFALITLISAVAMLLQKNVIVAGLCMVVTFFGVSGLFVLLANPVAAALQIIVYSGAIMVLVLFTIMLLNSHEEEPALQTRPIQRWGSVGLVGILAVGAITLISRSGMVAALDVGAGAGAAKLPIQAMTLENVGGALFSGHLLAFEVVGLLLLAAMVGAVSLTKKDL
jgi:NADH-quinone oxidoreductase subunit J